MLYAIYVIITNAVKIDYKIKLNFFKKLEKFKMPKKEKLRKGKYRVINWGAYRKHKSL